MKHIFRVALLAFAAAPLWIGCGASELLLPDSAGSGGATTSTSQSASQTAANATNSAGPQSATSTNGVGGSVGVGGASAVGTSGVGGSNAVSGTSGIGGTTNVATATASTNGVGVGPTCPSLGDPCTQCLSQACPPTYCNCVNDSECLKLIECTNGCNGDATCKQKCLTANPNGISEATLLGDCGATDCAGACPNSGMPLKPCSKCLFEDCQAEANACLAEPECLELFDCLNACPQVDLMCQQQCYMDHGGGIPTLQPLLMCTQQKCVPSCN